MSTWINFPENPEDYLGIVYLIENTHPDAIKKYYIGKKQLLKKTRLPANKARKRPKVVWRDNGAESYYGSSKELLEDIERYGKEFFKRTVIECCKTKWHLTFAELSWQLECKALFDPRFYNGIVNCRIGRPNKDYIDIPRNRAEIGL